jgi:hypothetical protein
MLSIGFSTELPVVCTSGGVDPERINSKLQRFLNLRFWSFDGGTTSVEYENHFYKIVFWPICLRNVINEVATIILYFTSRDEIECRPFFFLAALLPSQARPFNFKNFPQLRRSRLHWKRAFKNSAGKF